MDSHGVVEYLRALVITNAIAEYLPDEQTGKPSSLPTLVINALLLYYEDFGEHIYICNTIDI